MKTLRDIEHLEGVKVLVRVDFNVPITGGVVGDDFRIQAALPTINFLTSKKAKVILVSHAESSDGSNDSLEPIAVHLGKLGQKVTFIHNIKDAFGVIEHTMKNGDCILLENLRMYGDGEKKNDPKFSQELASLGDIYVNEAFPVSHRSHASIVGVPDFLRGYAGVQFEKEVLHLSKAFNPPHPFVFILGGAKFDTKIPLIQKFMDTADTVFIGGALANDLLKAKGHEIGKSLVSPTVRDLSQFVNNPKIMLPVDIINQNHEAKSVETLIPEDRILDAGPRTLELLKEKIKTAKFILWNGPLGLYEEGFQAPTRELALMISIATTEGVETVVGGGDTVGAIATLGMQDKFTFISTGGGAMLDFLAKGTLPGIEALKKSGGN